jgi:hypothetical protein
VVGKAGGSKTEIPSTLIHVSAVQDSGFSKLSARSRK